MSRLLLRAPRLEYSGSIRRRSHVAASGRRASIDAAAPEPEDWVGLGWVEDEAKGEEEREHTTCSDSGVRTAVAPRELGFGERPILDLVRRNCEAVRAERGGNRRARPEEQQGPLLGFVEREHDLGVRGTNERWGGILMGATGVFRGM